MQLFQPEGGTQGQQYFGAGAFDAINAGNRQARGDNQYAYVRNVAMRPCMDKNTYQVQDPECGSLGIA